MRMESQVKRLYSNRLAQRLTEAGESTKLKLKALADREAVQAISVMESRGYRLLNRLGNGEGLFVRRRDWVGLHVQLPADLYAKLESACVDREASKRQIVIGALRAYLAGEITEPTDITMPVRAKKPPPIATEQIGSAIEQDDSDEFYLG